MTTLLIDGDVLCYQATAACEQETQWSDDMWTLHTDAKAAMQMLHGNVSDLAETLKADDVVLCLSGQSDLNWRKGVLSTYKQNRAGMRKPIGYRAVVEYVRSTYSTVCEPALEGDDLMALIATRPFRGEHFVVVTIDKDLKGVPCNLYNPNRPELGVVEVSRFDADRWHMMQTLMGDATDGYTGCPGIGPVKAEKILSVALAEAEDGDDAAINVWRHILLAYSKAGLSDEIALQQARVSRILRHGEYDFNTKKVTLWQPPA